MQLDKFYQLVKSNELEIQSIINDIDAHYRERKEFKYDKNGNVKLDKNGKELFRVIRPSRGKLKDIQKCIHQNILSKIELPEFVMGSVKGKSNITNAIKHKGKKYKFQTDLKAFFDSVSHDQVFKMILNYGFGNKVAHLITKLTTFKGCLPQGTSTSPVLANLVFLPLDAKIQSFCLKNNIIYTRYVDDLTFSSYFEFKEKGQEILDIVKSEGYRISHKKTNYKSKTVITGVAISQNNADVTEEFKTKMENPINTPNQQKGYENYYLQVKKANKRK